MKTHLCVWSFSAAMFVAVAIVAVSSTNAATVWDLADDWDVSTSSAIGMGPDGVWSYVADNAGTEIVMDASIELAGAGGDGAAPNNTWHYTGGDGMWKNPWVAMTEQVPANRDLLVGEINTQPYASGPMNTIIRWTAPRDALVDISGFIWGAQLDQPSRAATVEVAHTNSAGTLLSTLVASQSYGMDGRDYGISLDASSISVSAGDRIDLVNGLGSVDSALSGLDFHIAEVAEPSTLILLGFGAIGLLVYGFRRRKRTA